RRLRRRAARRRVWIGVTRGRARHATVLSVEELSGRALDGRRRARVRFLIVATARNGGHCGAGSYEKVNASVHHPLPCTKARAETLSHFPRRAALHDRTREDNGA